MNVIERVFAVRATPPFNRLYDSEIVQIAKAARVRELAVGESLAPANRPLKYLVIVTRGRVDFGEEPAPPVFGQESLILGTPFGVDAVAGPEGATCLLLLRPHFLTVFQECPWILMELMEGPEGANGVRGTAPEGGSP